MNGVYKGDDDDAPPPDVRYSWTMRAFQILSGHYQAVADSLDFEGQIIARLSWVGFRPDSIEPKDIEATRYLIRKFNEDVENLSTNSLELIERLKLAFPCHTTVGDITVTAVHGVDSEDLLGFSAETLTLLGSEADKARQVLETYGKMSIDQMQANAILRRKFPEEWTPLNQLQSNEIENIKNLVGESIHPLVLRLRGPGTDFISDLQGQDVCVFSITHPEVLKLDPSHLRDLMIVGRPNSALCVLDYVAQGRHRCWFERDVMLWYAAARGLSIKGKLSLDWNKRNIIGRQSIYKAFGTGMETYSPSLGTDLRSEVIRQEKRSIEIWKAAKNVQEAFLSQDSSLLSVSIESYQSSLLNYVLTDDLLCETLYYQQYSQKLLMSKRFKTRDKIIQESLQKLSTVKKNQLLKEFNVIDWLSIGGIFLINGTPKTYQNEIIDVIRKAYKIVNSNLNSNVDLCELEMISKLVVPQLVPIRMTLGEKKGEMFSVKASEDSQTRAVTRRAQLAIQSNLQLANKHRSKGFTSFCEKNKLDLEKIFKTVRKNMLDLSNTPSNGYSVEFVNEKFGIIIKYTQFAVEILIEKHFSIKKNLSNEDLKIKENIMHSIKGLYNNDCIDLKVIDSFCGTYEDHGFFARLLELSFHFGDHSLKTKLSKSVKEILSVCELLYYILVLEKTSKFLTIGFSNINDDNSLNIWRKLSEFFAKTIDDHFYEYNPWFLDSKRGSAFVHFYDDLGIVKKEYSNLLYAISWSHHRTLYKFIRNLILNHSEISIKVPDEIDRNLLIGLVSFGADENGSEDIVQITSIGNSRVGEHEQNEIKNFEALWRSYNQLREISFMKNDGFEFPVVFSSFDSKFNHGLDSNRKVNFAILSPIGRTHYSRAIMESSSLNDNIFITRTGFFSDDGLNKSNKISKEKSYLFVEDAHFFLSSSQYYNCLKHHYGMNDADTSDQIEIDKKQGRLTSKGIRIAAKFKEPVLIGCCIGKYI